MKTTLLVALAAVSSAVSPALLAQTKSSVFGTKHDVAGLGGGCGSCHVSHQSSAKGQAILWAQNFPTTTTFGIYNSPTMNSTPTEVGGAYGPTNPPTGAKSYTVLCLSCHDGLTSPTVIPATGPTAIANPTNSGGLRNDHPVNLVYNPTADTGLEAIATVQASAVRLFSDGVNQTVQCGSCHDVHANAASFLRTPNTNAKAGLCTVCHK
jgi:predicted CXXCH cytochrome family protein